jgi:membrane protein YqaA with SNARE-associated domain
LSKLFRDPTDRLAEFVERSSSRADRMSRRQRWLLAAVILVAMCALGYGAFQASDYLEGFKQYGALGAFLVSFIASTSVFFPVFGWVFIGAIAANDASNWVLVALGSASGSALGQFTAYLVGYGGRAVIHKEQSIWYRRAEDWMGRYGSLAIFFFALTFLPVDVAGIVAGALRFPYWKYLLATFVGYLPKTLVGCYLAHSVFRRWPSLGELLGGMPWWSWMMIAVGIALIVAGVVLLCLERRQRKKVEVSAKDKPSSMNDN